MNKRFVLISVGIVLLLPVTNETWQEQKILLLVLVALLHYQVKLALTGCAYTNVDECSPFLDVAPTRPQRRAG